jgi:beta-1,2-mannosidase
MSRLPRIKISKPVSASFLVLFLALGTLSATFTPPILNWSRLSHKPTLSPRGHGFESAGTFNPAVTKFDGKFVMLYRAQDRNGTSSLGYATSSDGVHFRRSEQPAFRPETDYEKGGGVEDPRLQKIGDIYYMTYTGFNNVDGRGPDHKEAQLCLAASRDLVHWDRKGVILPANTGSWNVGWTKSGAIVPQKIDGKYWMYYPGTLAGRKRKWAWLHRRICCIGRMRSIIPC